MVVEVPIAQRSHEYEQLARAAGVPHSFAGLARAHADVDELVLDDSDAVCEHVVNQLGLSSRAADPQEASFYESLFNPMDVDGDGQLTAAELRTALSPFDMRLTPTQTQHMVVQADSDGDLRISLSEFIKCAGELGFEPQVVELP